jgi:hypothetical protein
LPEQLETEPMSKKLEILKAARELLARPNGWCQDTFATTELGNTCSVLSDVAARFCAAGALDRAAMVEVYGNRNGLEAEAVADALNAEAVRFGFVNLPDFNDATDRTQAEVVALYDRVIAAVELEEAA